MTLARQRVLSSSEVRTSDLEHGGSWVRIPSGAQIFSVSSYGWFFTSPIISFIKLKTKGKINAMNLYQNCEYLWNICFSRRSIWVLLELGSKWIQHLTDIDQEQRKIEQIFIWNPMTTKCGRRRETIVLHFKKSLNKHVSRSVMLIKYFYLFFTAVFARLKHNLRLLFQRKTMYN